MVGQGGASPADTGTGEAYTRHMSCIDGWAGRGQAPPLHFIGFVYKSLTYSHAYGTLVLHLRNRYGRRPISAFVIVLENI